MTVTVVTVVSKNYCVLLRPWLKALRQYLPHGLCVILCADVTSLDFASEMVAEEGKERPLLVPAVEPHAMSHSEELHAAGLKLLILEYLPPDVEQYIYLDVDVFAIGPLTSESLSLCGADLAMAVDYFVGYKERMEAEFRPLMKGFRPRRYDDGRFYYFNTGVIVACQSSRALFRRTLATWSRFRAVTGRLPAILDQNVFNYCLSDSSLVVRELSSGLNWLRTYPAKVEGGRVLSPRGGLVRLLHMNGGTPSVKSQRYKRLSFMLGKSRGCLRGGNLSTILDDSSLPRPQMNAEGTEGGGRFVC